jgi:hypothetical protein
MTKSSLVDMVIETDMAKIQQTIFGAEVRFHAVPDLRVEQCYHELQNLVIRLSAAVWSEVVQDETVYLTIETPATCWQHFKQQYFPKWALKKWPVITEKKTQSYDFKTIALFPEFRYNSPNRDMGRYIFRTMVEKNDEGKA